MFVLRQTKETIVDNADAESVEVVASENGAENAVIDWLNHVVLPNQTLFVTTGINRVRSHVRIQIQLMLEDLLSGRLNSYIFSRVHVCKKLNYEFKN